MRGKISQLEVDSVQREYGNFKQSESSGKNRLDLNVLLKRIEDRKKVDKRANTIIFSSVGLMAVIVVLLVAIT